MLSFTKPTSDQDGEGIAPDAETTPEAVGPAAVAASPEVRPLFADAESASTPADTTYDPAVRSQIQRVRLDLLSRETERLEQQLRQVLEQQNEDRQLREELRGQIANLNQRIEGLLAGAPKSAEAGGTDGDLRTAVKPLLQAVMQMLDSAEAADSAEATASSSYSEAWAQVDAARHAPAAGFVEPAQVAAPAAEAETLDTTGETGEADGRDAPEPNAPEAEAALGTAAEPEEDLDLDPEAELRIEIARLLRPKKAGGGYEPLGPQATPTAQRAEAESAPGRPSPAAEPAKAEVAPTRSLPTTARAVNPEPLLLGTDETPAVGDAPPSKSRAVESAPKQRLGGGLDSRAEGRGDSSDGPKADTVQGDLRGGGAVPNGQRPSWAPRPNSMRASLPKCLTEPWEEPGHRPSGRWPFRRTRPAAGPDEPTE